MECTSNLSTESFSRSWLVGYNPTSDASPAPEKRQNSCSTSFDAADEASFIEMDPKLSDSRRFYRVGKDFSFDFRARESPVILADADELITDGLLLPLSDQLYKSETTTTCDYYYNYADDDKPEFNASPKLISSFSQKEGKNNNSSNNEVACASLRRCKSVTKRIYNKYLEFIAPLCEKLRRRRSASRVSSMSSQFDHCSPAVTSSPANSTASANKYEHFFAHSDCPISDAVLHCKRTNGMQYQLA